MTQQTTALTVQTPKQLLEYLNKSKSAIEMALPKHLNPERMLRLALTCFSSNPDIRRCAPESILSSLVIASQIGLEPGVAGQGYLIPYGNKCTFIPGWQGLVGLLNNTGRATAWTGSVFEGDVWEFELGSNPRCRHIPGPNYGDPDQLRWVYACGQVNGSQLPVIEAWPMGRIVKHRDKYNKVGQKHYSYANMEMYARKVVLLQVLKYMPRSIELNNAIVAADAAEVGREIRVDAGTIVEVDSEITPEPKAANLGTSPAPAAPRQRTSAPPAPAVATPVSAPAAATAPKAPVAPAAPLKAAQPKPSAAVEALKADPEPEPEPEAEPEPENLADQGEPLPEGSSVAQEPELEPEPTKPEPSGDEPVEITKLRAMMAQSDVNENQVMAWAKSKSVARDNQNKLMDFATPGQPTKKVSTIITAWPNIAKDVQKFPK